MIDFTLTDEQRELQSIARRFARETIRPAEVELDRLSDADAIFEHERFKETLRQAYDLGFHKMAIKEENGGLGLDPSTTGLIWEELAMGGVGFAGTLLAGQVLPLFIDVLASHRADLIDAFVRPYCDDDTGTYTTAWGSSEPNIGSDGSNYYDKSIHHDTSITRDGDGWVIDGAKSGFVSNAGLAKAHLVFACVDPDQGICGSGVFLVPAGPGVTAGKALDKSGMRVLNQADVHFDSVRIPSDYLLIPPSPNFPMIHNAIKTVGNVGVGYLAVGLMRAAYEEALAYAKTRVQFGKPILQHQAVGFKLFECYQAIEAARMLLWRASNVLAKQMLGDLKLSAAARVFACNQAMRHTVEMVQVLGGYGISREYCVEKFMRDAKLLQIMDATVEIMTNKAVALM